MDTALEGIRLHIDDYLVKPANADELIALLANKLAKRPSDHISAGSRVAET
jgi:YesN/AraC family two-component response regulator